VLTLFRRGPPGIVRCTMSKKAQDAAEKYQEEKRQEAEKRQEEAEKEQARRSL